MSTITAMNPIKMMTIESEESAVEFTNDELYGELDDITNLPDQVVFTLEDGTELIYTFTREQNTGEVPLPN